MPFATIVDNASPSGKYGESIRAAIRRSPCSSAKTPASAPDTR
jgi:hypothetical protein